MRRFRLFLGQCSSSFLVPSNKPIPYIFRNFFIFTYSSVYTIFKNKLLFLSLLTEFLCSGNVLWCVVCHLYLPDVHRGRHLANCGRLRLDCHRGKRRRTCSSQSGRQGRIDSSQSGHQGHINSTQSCRQENFNYFIYYFEFSSSEKFERFVSNFICILTFGWVNFFLSKNVRIGSCQTMLNQVKHICWLIFDARKAVFLCVIYMYIILQIISLLFFFIPR